MINNQSFSIRCCDPDRIQTCNLLIRSQMLYSVEPRGLSLNCDAKGCSIQLSHGAFPLIAMQRYAVFLEPPNVFASFFNKILFLHGQKPFLHENVK